MDLFTSPLEDEEMLLRELSMPSMEDIEMQKSNLAVATTHYEVKPRIIKLVATNPFRGLEDDNPYRHIKDDNKKEFWPLGSSGIFICPLSKMKHEDDVHLHLLK
jgi:hypothetical protein